MRRLAILLGLGLLAAPAPALAGTWSVGSNFGLSFFNPKDGDNSTVIGIPGAAGGLQPGLRIGRRSDDRLHEFFADAGLLWSDTGDVSSKALEMTGNYQYNFAGEPTGPYVTAGLGLFFNGFDLPSGGSPGSTVSLSSTSAVYGVGAGLRRPLGSSDATLRFEARWDRITEGKDGDFVVQPEGSAIGLKLGFDVWL